MATRDTSSVLAEKETSGRHLSIHAIIAYDFLTRLRVIFSRIEVSLLGFFSLIPTVSAAENSTAFVPHVSNESFVQEDINGMTDLFDFWGWKARGDAIRYGNDRNQCIGNLSLALAAVTPLTASAANGSSGALTLLPTAGALIGAPTKELWVVYKLMPFAGVLSMLLSLGGTMIPNQASDYELKTSAFSYGGYIATTSKESEDFDETLPSRDGAEDFAAKVITRANDVRGGHKYIRVWYGIALQLFWIGVVLISCWFTESGTILSWWCQNTAWMLTWYSWVALSSLLENTAGVPFTHQWTLRCSRAPKIRISNDAPRVSSLQSDRTPLYATETNIEPTNGKDATIQVFEDSTLLRASSRSLTETLDALEQGYNCRGKVIMDPNEPWSASRVPFYVIISVEGISSQHATLRVVSKAISVGVFAAGTATFASANFVTISVALTILCLVLGAGVFGRVIAMWMASEMIKSRPVLHRVVKNRQEANKYVEQILATDGLTIEVMGHIIVNGRCIKRYNTWLQWSKYIGILAAPYDISRLAVST